MANQMEHPQLPLGVLAKMTSGAELDQVEQTAFEIYTGQVQEWENRQQRLGIVDLGEVMADGDTEPRMLVDGLFVEAMHHIVFGEKESAKTWLLLHAATRLMVEGRTVLWIDQEMGRADFARRLKTLGLPPETVTEQFVYSEFAAFELDSIEHRALWHALLQHRRPALVVVDAHTEVLATADLNENSGTDVARWHMAYMAPALALGATTVMIDHSGFADNGRSRGSGHKGAQSKVELQVETKPGFDRDKTGTMTVTRRKNTPAADIPEEQKFTVGGDGAGGFVFEPASDKLPAGHRDAELRAVETRRAIVQLLREHDKPLNQSQILKIVTGRKQAIVDAIEFLKDFKVIVATPVGKSIEYELGPNADMPLGTGSGFSPQGATT